MMEPILFVILLTAATGVGGLALGGVLAALVKRESPRGTSLLLSFTAGLMLAIVALDMVPEAMEAAPWLPMTPLVLVAGFVVTYLLNCWIDKSAHHEDKNNPHHCACGHHDLHTAGIVLAAAVALHNVPVGMAVGASVAVQGICLASVLAAVTIGLHNLPEGMSIAVPLLHDGSKTWSAIGVAALSGLPTSWVRCSDILWAARPRRRWPPPWLWPEGPCCTWCFLSFCPRRPSSGSPAGPSWPRWWALPWGCC